MKSGKFIANIVLSLALIVTAIPAEQAEAATAKKIQYGDTITATVERRSVGACSQVDPSVAKWKKDGTETFKVEEGADQFIAIANDVSEVEEDRKNLRKCLGKKVNQKFTIVVEGGDGTYYTRYTIKKISRPKVSKKIIAKAYKDFLTSGKVNHYVCGTQDIKFAMIDLNHDGYKELYVTGDDRYHGSVLAYLGGEVTYVNGEFSGDYAYYKNANLVFTCSAHTGYYPEEYAQYVNGCINVLANAEGYDYFDKNDNFKIKYKYYIKGKKTTKAKYNAYVKKLTKGKKQAKIVLHKNTASNRKKYIK